jgi:hypothetical protein
MSNIYCTLALGDLYVGLTRFLADDLRDFKQTLVVVTDQPKMFRNCRNVVAKPYYPASFSYHDKRFALRHALDLGDTAIFLDADCALRFGIPKLIAQQALQYAFPPGFHGWDISSAELYDYGHFEKLGQSWGLNFDRHQIVYQEILFALTREGGKEERFFEIWERFAQEAQERGFNGAGEGTCFGIAAQDCLTCHGTKHMDESHLKNIFWHTRLNWRLRRLYHAKFKLKSLLTRQAPFDLKSVEIAGRAGK